MIARAVAWLRSRGRWKTVWSSGKFDYQQHTRTGKRRAIVSNPGGWQPLATDWIMGRTDELPKRPKPPTPTRPRGGSSVTTRADRCCNCCRTAYHQGGAIQPIAARPTTPPPPKPKR
ncbi:hypothetical protein LCM08_06270 [Salipiger pacificus]|nr:hypothetical protein [Alloyangia pacifica]